MKVKLLFLAALICLHISGLAQTNFAAFPPGILRSDNALSAALELADPESFSGDFQAAVDAVKRIETSEPTNWLATYYVAYLETLQSFSAEPGRKQVLLDAVNERLGKLIEDASADPSEIYNLMGYYSYARVDQDPENNAPIYYREGIINYHKAIFANPLNPRPRYLLILFEEKTSGYIGKKPTDICAKLNKSKFYFSNFKLSHKNDPDWGEKGLYQNIAMRCSKY